MKTSISPDTKVNNYKNIRFIKLGRWATYPADVELWHTADTSDYFEEYFGIWKEILAICVFDAEYGNHMYVPERFLKKLYQGIADMTKDDYKGCEKILMQFYQDREYIKKETLANTPGNISALDTDALIRAYVKNRDLAHRIVVYDQLTWIAEDYWIPLMDAVLIDKLGLTKGSPECTEALFALTKPQHISTTLEEKRAAIECALRIKHGEESSTCGAEELAHRYGWMPVLAYGTPWDAKKYEEELENLLKQDVEWLREEYSALERYTELRDRDLQAIVDRYKLSSEDLQIFIDFGLAIDTRNEAEYVASFVGFYLLPLYEEMMKRLDLSIVELRTLCQEEIVACLRGQRDAKTILAERGRVRSWFLDGETKQRIHFTSREGEALFAMVERQQVTSSDESNDIEPLVRKGITASRGKVEGRVRLVPTPEDNDKVQEGDIFFAYSTMVDNLPAMKKAAAFVTESGGLTCHAAVIAREFGVPCIVGLKDAMMLFQDGDMVEVDADSGVVRRM